MRCAEIVRGKIRKDPQNRSARLTLADDTWAFGVCIFESVVRADDNTLFDQMSDQILLDVLMTGAVDPILEPELPTKSFQDTTFMRKWFPEMAEDVLHKHGHKLLLLMSDCTQYDESQRPNFSAICKQLSQMHQALQAAARPKEPARGKKKKKTKNPLEEQGESLATALERAEETATSPKASTDKEKGGSVLELPEEDVASPVSTPHENGTNAGKLDIQVEGGDDAVTDDAVMLAVGVSPRTKIRQDRTMLAGVGDDDDEMLIDCLTDPDVEREQAEMFERRQEVNKQQSELFQRRTSHTKQDGKDRSRRSQSIVAKSM